MAAEPGWIILTDFEKNETYHMGQKNNSADAEL